MAGVFEVRSVKSGKDADGTTGHVTIAHLLIDSAVPSKVYQAKYAAGLSG